MTQNKLEEAEKRVVKMNRLMRDKFKNQDALAKALKDKTGADANGNLEQQDFVAFVVDSCREELIDRKVNK